jgi:hypothetical protein
MFRHGSSIFRASFGARLFVGTGGARHVVHQRKRRTLKERPRSRSILSPRRGSLLNSFLLSILEAIARHWLSTLDQGCQEADLACHVRLYQVEFGATVSISVDLGRTWITVDGLVLAFGMQIA